MTARDPMRLLAGGLVASLCLGGLLVTPHGAVYDSEGQQRGYVRESAPGQFDLYDTHSRRFGYGRQGRDGTIELFDKHSRRILTIRPERSGPRRP